MEYSRKEPFSQEEIQKIMAVLTDPQEILLICMLLLGMRISEPLGRRINDIKWANKIVQIIKRDDDPKDGNVKYGSERDVPITPILYFSNLPEVMYEAYRDYVYLTLRPKKDINKPNYLFINRYGGPLSYESIYQRIIRKKLQPLFPYREIVFHTFRHHLATTKIALGTPIETVQNILGHRHISQTIEDYYNPTLRLLGDLVMRKEIDSSVAKSRVEYIINYKKRFCFKNN